MVVRITALENFKIYVKIVKILTKEEVPERRSKGGL